MNEKSKEPLRFFYLLQDDVFISIDRTKFFDSLLYLSNSSELTPLTYSRLNVAFFNLIDYLVQFGTRKNNAEN
jgi:hypothetical protein